MLNQIRNPHFYIVLAGDLILFSLSLVGAYLMRFEFRLETGSIEQLYLLLPVFVPLKALIFFLMDVYRGMFRYASLFDILRVFRATLVSSLVAMFIILTVFRFQGFSRAVFILDAGLTFFLVGGFRSAIRIAFQHYEKGKIKDFVPMNMIRSKDDTPIIIVGAGNTGEKILREIKGNPHLKYYVAGYVDDDPGKKMRTIHGVHILGEIDKLPRLASKYRVQELLLAIPSATGDQMRRIVRLCEETGLPYKTLPGIGELINGKVSIKALRDVNYKDLLRREPVQLDIPEIKEFIKNQRILVTGAGGSIGSELCRQIVRFMPEELILVDTSEPNLYNIQMELKHRVGFLKYTTILGAVQDGNLMDQTLRKYNPQVIFHAAAYKHVPLLERNPWQAVANNIIGTKTILEKAVEHKIKHFILVSTDKSVRPTNVMGASKRVCELILNAYKENGTAMRSVRFGNVVGSAGSVIPLFQEQIKRGGPVTVTHPEVTRFFMTIPEASQLILQAAVLGTDGEIFLLEMGTPVKIIDMARDLIRLSGKEPDKDIQIEFTGLRQGEKLYEELITQGEDVVETAHEKIMVLNNSNGWNGYKDQAAYRDWLFSRIDELNHLAQEHDACGIKDTLTEIVPEYTMQDSTCVL
jgi:FlaA1/EpsC-like NDP-sugar epimerase